VFGEPVLFEITLRDPDFLPALHGEAHAQTLGMPLDQLPNVARLREPQERREVHITHAGFGPCIPAFRKYWDSPDKSKSWISRHSGDIK
jgi:hypothetical protein